MDRADLIRNWIALATFVGLASSTLGSDNPPSLRVHEWGTFTSLQDERGESIGGLNVDDEPVPSFVHRLSPGFVIDGRRSSALRGKGLPLAHPQVTMRLETPVIYFHPPRGWTEPIEVDVGVAFRGGWLTEFYPDARVVAPGVRTESGSTTPGFGPLVAETVGTLTWNDLLVGVEAVGPQTDARVWLAPRAVDAADLSTPAGESERYLFYRGVAHRESPIRISRDLNGDLLQLSPHLATTRKVGPLAIEDQWLVDIRRDGTVAFRVLPAWIATDTSSRIETSASFTDGEYSRENLQTLRSAMHDSLIVAGLHDDEANAMLETWKLSYFESPGLRLFFLVPRVWTDHVLPLEISTSPLAARTRQKLSPRNIERVMMGRVELVTDRQRSLIELITAGAASGGQSSAAFEALGRFRHALLLNELRVRPTAALEQFMTAAGIHPTVR